ncbi:peflin or Penta-EF hand domain-containing protein 1 [Branchiostoma belcheri]|nr:peflin or Penta-EF hand domain-containing protein 1 [Branchiostoma belcheri]
MAYPGGPPGGYQQYPGGAPPPSTEHHPQGGSLAMQGVINNQVTGDSLVTEPRPVSPPRPVTDRHPVSTLTCTSGSSRWIGTGMFDRDQSGQIDLNEFQALWTYIQQWKGVFDRYDQDRSGLIEARELHTAFSQMGYNVSQSFIGIVVVKFDRAARRGLKFDDFIQSCVMLKNLTDQFRARDTAMTGRIQVSYEDFMCMVLLNKPS